MLNELLGKLDQYGLLDGTTVLTMQNMTELSFCIRAVCRSSWVRQTIWITRSGLPPISFWILVAMAWQAVTAVRWMFRTSRRTAPFSRAFAGGKPCGHPGADPGTPAEDTTDAAADAAADGADLTADAPQDDTQSQE